MTSPSNKVTVELDQGEILTVWVALSNYIYRMKQFLDGTDASYRKELGQYDRMKEVFNEAYERAKVENGL